MDEIQEKYQEALMVLEILESNDPMYKHLWEPLTENTIIEPVDYDDLNARLLRLELLTEEEIFDYMESRKK